LRLGIRLALLDFTSRGAAVGSVCFNHRRDDGDRRIRRYQLVNRRRDVGKVLSGDYAELRA
jgi:hypothetical protein